MQNSVLPLSSSLPRICRTCPAYNLHCSISCAELIVVQWSALFALLLEEVWFAFALAGQLATERRGTCFGIRIIEALGCLTVSFCTALTARIPALERAHIGNLETSVAALQRQDMIFTGHATNWCKIHLGPSPK